MEFRGTAAPNAIIQIYEGTMQLAARQTGSSGFFSIEFAAPDGNHTYEVRDDSGGSVLRSVRVDSTAPAKPSLNASVSGSTVTLSGAATGDTVSVELFDNEVSIGFAELIGGQYTKVLSGVAPGQHVYTAGARDAAGNFAESDPRVVTISNAPDPPEIFEPGEGTTVGTSNVRLTGSAAANARIDVYQNGELRTSATASALGQWEATVPGVADGQHTFRATATLDGATSQPRTRTVTVNAPDAPVVTSPAEGAVLNTATVTFTGTAQPGHFVEAREGIADRGNVQVSAGGTWSLQIALTDGAHTITFRAWEGGAAVSLPVTRSVTVDREAPPVPTLSGEATGPQTIRLFGGAGGATQVRLFQNGQAIGEVGVDGGEYERILNDVPPGTYTFTARGLDAAGNESALSAPVTLTLSGGQPPPPPPAPQAASILAASASGSTVTLSGTAPGATTVELFDGGRRSGRSRSPRTARGRPSSTTSPRASTPTRRSRATARARRRPRRRGR